MKPCYLCPRECGVDRDCNLGYCMAESVPTVAKIMLHKWEEPCICYGNGSGAIFFSACQLRCLYCQNHEISRTAVGNKMNADALYRAFFELKAIGACNINLVSPTPHLETLIPAIERAKRDGLDLPFVFNSGGYEKAETIHRLSKLIDVYLLDFKYSSRELSAKYSSASDYKKHCINTLYEALSQCEPLAFSGSRLVKGVIVRHLVLPGAVEDSKKILLELSEMGLNSRIVLSLMRQYTPTRHVNNVPPLNRKLTSLEYGRAVAYAEALNFRYLYTQKRESANEEFIPDFSANN